MELSLDRYASESHSRRVILTRGLGALALGLASRGPLALASTDRVSSEPACALTSEQTTGPYYIDRKVMRYDLTEGKPGVPFEAAYRVGRCEALRASEGRGARHLALRRDGRLFRLHGEQSRWPSRRWAVI
jgi:hypothetical protein